MTYIKLAELLHIASFDKRKKFVGACAGVLRLKGTLQLFMNFLF